MPNDGNTVTSSDIPAVAGPKRGINIDLWVLTVCRRRHWKASQGEPWVEKCHKEMRDVSLYNSAIEVALRAARLVAPISRMAVDGNPILVGVVINARLPVNGRGQ